MASSFFSKAKIAFHTAAAKAEKIITEIKEDIKTEFGRSSLSDPDEPRNNVEWSLKNVLDKNFEDRLYDCILNISKDPEKFFLLFYEDDANGEDIPIKKRLSTKLLEDTKELQNLKFEFVPEKIQEDEFWKCTFMTVDRVKQEVHCLDKWVDNNSLFQYQPESESPEKDPADEDAYEKAMSLAMVPSSKLLRKLFGVIEAVRSVDKMKDLQQLKTEKDPSQCSGLVSGLTAMRNTLLRESKDLEICNREVQACMSSLFTVGAQRTEFIEQAFKTRIPQEIQGAPPSSFVSHLAELMGSIGSYRQMAEFWRSVVEEAVMYGITSESFEILRILTFCKQLRHCWEEGKPIPWLPVDSKPDLRYCLILQKLQVINCCIARQKRHTADLEFVDALNECMEIMTPRNIEDIESFFLLLKSRSTLKVEGILEPSRWFAELKPGQIFLRVGADHPAGDLKMLETGHQIYSPVTQDGAVLTEDLIEETEELVLRTGSVGPGCSRLLSDMQAFKAANPGCILEDFVRWYSPLDWKPYPETRSPVEHCQRGNQGYLSTRMQSQGNLWRELWTSAKPIPAAKQARLFDEDLAVESTLDTLDGIKPVDLFEQLFKALLGTGFTIAEQSLLGEKGLSLSQFNECKNFITTICHKGMNSNELEQLCQVYEMMENLLHHSSKGLHHARTCNYSAKGNDDDEQEHQGSHQCKPDNGLNFFARFLEAKSSFFEKKSSQDEKKIENEWTIV